MMVVVQSVERPILFLSPIRTNYDDCGQTWHLSFCLHAHIYVCSQVLASGSLILEL
jgi:hypothetical protein